MKTALITGSSRGIGAAIARRLAKSYKIVINYNNSEEPALSLLKELRQVNPNVIAVKADMTKEDEVDYLFKTAEANFGHVDILINNAGKSYVGLIQDMDFEKWQEMVNTNLNSVFLATKRALGPMISEKSGVIINISSIWGMIGGSMESCYSATKAAIIGLTKSLAKEFGYSNIKINAIAPGAIDTPMLDNISRDDLDYVIEDTPMGRLGTPEDIANLVEFLISDKNSFMTGQILSPNGGFVIV